MPEAFLTGWAVGGLLLFLSGPFYPFPERGHITVQIPLFLITAGIVMTLHPRIRAVHIAVVLLLIGSTPVWQVHSHWQRTMFRSDQPHKYLSVEHVAVVRELVAAATKDDVLVASDWRQLSWLAPEFPGRFYVAHGILTVDAGRKWQDVRRFMAGTPDEQGRFLTRNNIRFVFASARHDRDSLDRVPGLEPLRETSFGTLYRFDGARAAVSADPPGGRSDPRSGLRTR